MPRRKTRNPGADKSPLEKENRSGTATTPGRRGRKRKVVEEDEAQTPTPAKTPKTPGEVASLTLK